MPAQSQPQARKDGADGGRQPAVATLHEGTHPVVRNAALGIKESEKLAHDWMTFYRQQMEEVLAAGTAWMHCDSMGELMDAERKHHQAMTDRYVQYSQQFTEQLSTAAQAFVNGGDKHAE